MAAAAILDNFEWPLYPQRLTIYLYSAHRAVIFAIAQLSCSFSCPPLETTFFARIDTVFASDDVFWWD